MSPRKFNRRVYALTKPSRFADGYGTSVKGRISDPAPEHLDFLANLVRAISIPASIVDGQGRIWASNESFRQAFLHFAQEIDHFERIVHPAFHRIHACFCRYRDSHRCWGNEAVRNDMAATSEQGIQIGILPWSGQDLFLVQVNVPAEFGMPHWGGPLTSQLDHTPIAEGYSDLCLPRQYERESPDPELVATDRKWLHVLESAGDGVMTVSCNGRILYANDAAGQMFGFSKTSLQNRKFGELLAPAFRRLVDPSTLHSNSRKWTRLESAGLRNDGSVFPLEISLGNTCGKVDSCRTAILRDVTERKKQQRDVLATAAAHQRHIGQELHDRTGQELTGLSLLVRELQDQFHGEQGRLSELTQKIAQGVDTVFRGIQGLSRGLIAEDLKGQKLGSALKSIAAEVNAATGVCCSVLIPEGDPPLSTEMTTHLFRIVQEAISNAIRHGQAENIKIQLEWKDKVLSLKVSDDGIGILCGDSTVRGVGLRNMHHRAALIGACLDVVPGDESGSIVLCVLPLEAR